MFACIFVRHNVPVTWQTISLSFWDERQPLVSSNLSPHLNTRLFSFLFFLSLLLRCVHCFHQTAILQLKKMIVASYRRHSCQPFFSFCFPWLSSASKSRMRAPHLLCNLLFLSFWLHLFVNGMLLFFLFPPTATDEPAPIYARAKLMKPNYMLPYFRLDPTFLCLDMRTKYHSLFFYQQNFKAKRVRGCFFCFFFLIKSRLSKKGLYKRCMVKMKIRLIDYIARYKNWPH